MTKRKQRRAHAAWSAQTRAISREAARGLALVIVELLPQAFTAATWRLAAAGFAAGAALMLALSAVLGV